jgi:hypothetical protein
MARSQSSRSPRNAERLVAVARLATHALAHGPGVGFNAVKTFSATLAAGRNQLGDVVTAWLRAHPGIELVDITLTQSSDAQYHCLTITLFWHDPRADDHHGS